MSAIDILAAFGAIDIYLFDQLLRGRIPPGAVVMDAGCGTGRNLQYLLQAGYDVYGLDANAAAVAEAQRMAAALVPGFDRARLRAESIAHSSFPDALADVVISSAVLHFARDDEEFDGLLAGSWRLLAPGGLFFCRLASSIGIEAHVPEAGAGRRRCRLPDGSDRYLVDQALLVERTARLGGRLLDPLKTTVVQNQRAMTTWVVRKGPR
jgi:SAM-dependent methyltransferase